MSAKGLLRYRSESSGEGGPPRPPSMGSDGGTSLASSPESRTAVLEEERDDSFDEGIDDILAENPSCNLCGHNFYSTADFLNHVRMHFSGGAKEADSRKRRADEGWEAEKATKAKTPRTSPSSQQDRSPGGGDQMVNFSAQEEPKEQVRRGSSRTPSPPTALPARSPTFPPAAPAPNQPPAELLELLSSHQHMVHQQQQAQLQAAAGPYGPLAPPYNPFLPHMPYPNYQPPPYPFMAQPVAPPSKCPWCPAIFEKQEAMLYHMQLHQLQQPQQQAYQPQHPPQEQARRPRPSPPPPCGPNCGCNSCSQERARKAKKAVQDIDYATLRKIEKHEWEKKNGYWCTKCKKRFSSQMKLVDHMSYSEEHNFKKQDRPGNSSSPGGSGQGSPTPSL